MHKHERLYYVLYLWHTRSYTVRASVLGAEIPFLYNIYMYNYLYIIYTLSYTTTGITKESKNKLIFSTSILSLYYFFSFRFALIVPNVNLSFNEVSQSHCSTYTHMVIDRYICVYTVDRFWNRCEK
jgi:hypothetical protein